MPFVANTFVDGPAGGTPITAATLNNLELGLVAADVTNPSSAAATFIDAQYSRAVYFDAERYKNTNTDLQALQAAMAAATAAGNGNMVRLSARTWDVGNGLSMSGYSCGLIGVGAGHTSTTPSGTVLYASTQTGAVLDLTGWVCPDSYRGRIEIGNFSLRGSNVADATKVKIGLRNSTNAIGSTTFRNIAISQTGGPCVDMYMAYLCDFERITAVTPVGAKANDVAYMIFRGCNGNRFVGMGFRSISASADTGVSGALVVTDDGVYQSQGNEWIAPWFEFLHIPTNGNLINNKANAQNWRGVYFVDCGKEVGATGTSWVNFAPSAFTDSGSNLWDGIVPGRDSASTISPDVGIAVTQSRNMILGPKGYKGTNVVLASGVTNTTIILAGAQSGATDPAVVDNSGNVSNVYFDHMNRTHRWRSWVQDETLAASGGAGMRISDPATPAAGALWLGTSGIRVQAASGVLYATSDSINFRDSTLAQMGFADRFAGWQLNGAIQLVSPATTTVAPAAGGAGALPATPAGYVTITIAGTARKLPYY